MTKTWKTQTWAYEQTMNLPDKRLCPDTELVELRDAMAADPDYRLR
jgi:hypothetical protein